jgi:hypothetical protein
MKEKKRNEKKNVRGGYTRCHVISSTCQGQIEEIERGKL